MVVFGDISHLALEVTNLERSESFYRALGMEVICRDQGELGEGRVILRNATNQLLILERVDKLSPRSRFRSWDPKRVPDPDGDERYAGAHLALSVASVKAYDEVYQKLLEQGVYLEGDIRASERAPGEKSVYFYDPSGNRLQLIILPPKAPAA
jgi:catechol 2,3-dioxygenase-like lactoylglutathione lyase family enzyme